MFFSCKYLGILSVFLLKLRVFSSSFFLSFLLFLYHSSLCNIIGFVPAPIWKTFISFKVLSLSFHLYHIPPTSIFLKSYSYLSIILFQSSFIRYIIFFMSSKVLNFTQITFLSCARMPQYFFYRGYPASYFFSIFMFIFTHGDNAGRRRTLTTLGRARSILLQF